MVCIPFFWEVVWYQIEDMENEIERRTLTYSRWENSVKGKGRQGWHPVTFSFADAALKAITDIQVCVFL